MPTKRSAALPFQLQPSTASNNLADLASRANRNIEARINFLREVTTPQALVRCSSRWSVKPRREANTCPTDAADIHPDYVCA
jgi:hypothetical protein